jgi:hypothetical protein
MAVVAGGRIRHDPTKMGRLESSPLMNSFLFRLSLSLSFTRNSAGRGTEPTRGTDDRRQQFLIYHQEASRAFSSWNISLSLSLSLSVAFSLMFHGTVTHPCFLLGKSRDLGG